MDIITYALLKKRIKELEEKVDNLGKFLGITTSQLTDGCSTNPIIIDNELVTAKTGDWVIRYDTDKEFAFNGTIWQEFGDNSNVAKIYYDTKEGWNQKSSLIGEKEAFYIYTNYSHDEFGNDIPGVKIGDGQAYLVDIPFLDANYQSHIENTEIHITQAEREFWNSHNGNIYCNTTAYWESLPSLQSEKDAIYVYTDHQQLDGNDIPGMKIGDGNAYLIDLPFVDAVYAEHIANSIIHVTQEDRLVWDNNVTCFIAPNKDDRLVFRKRQN